MTDEREQLMVTLSWAAEPLQQAELFRRSKGLKPRVAIAAADELVRMGYLAVNAENGHHLTESGQRYMARRFEREPFGKYTAFKPIEHGPRLAPPGAALQTALDEQNRRTKLEIASLFAFPLIIVVALFLFGNR